MCMESNYIRMEEGRCVGLRSAELDLAVFRMKRVQFHIEGPRLRTGFRTLGLRYDITSGCVEDFGHAMSFLEFEFQEGRRKAGAEHLCACR